MRKGEIVKYLAALGFVLTVYAANVAIAQWGIVDVGFGFQAPAAVFFAGLAFTMRDLTREAGGRLLTFAAVVVGAALSYVLEDVDRIAVASAVAFGVSELADFAAYEPLRERSRALAVGVSNAIGLVLDSLIFLWLAFGSLEFLPGQIIGKAYMTALAVLLVLGAEYALSLRLRQSRRNRVRAS